MQTTLRSAFITDLLLPPPTSLPHLRPSQIATFGYDTAISILQDPEKFIRSNPLVTNVRALHSPSESKNYIDVPHWCTLFNLSYLGDPERGISSEWQQFEITDKLSLGLVSSDLVYVTAMRRIPGGFESVTSPGSGVRIYGRFEILRPSELSRLSVVPTNLSILDSEDGGAGGSGGGNATTTITNAVPPTHDYTADAPNAVPGWSDPSIPQPPPPPPPASSALSSTNLQPSDRPTSSSKANTRPTSSPSYTATNTPKADASGIIHFLEHNETRCNALLSLYIKATTAKSHRHMHENFKRRWGEMIKQGLSNGDVVSSVGVDGEARRPAAGERKVGGVEGVGLDARLGRSRDGSRQRGEGERGSHERTGSSLRTTVR